MPPFPPVRQTFWPMLLLFLAAIFYSIDKAIVGVLADPIKADLGIDDIEMGLLMGLAYSLLSGVCGLWLGSLVDRHVRKRVLGGAIIAWSLSTALGGLAPNFATFFIFRALVGLGEAAVAPAAMSLIADMFPPERRGRALSAYLIGATIGTALSSVVPGAILAANLHITLPGYGLVIPWRSAFLLCGIVGPIVGIAFLTIREPARRGISPERKAPARVGDKLAYLLRQRTLIAPLFGGFCLYYLAFVGVTSWTAPLLMRTYGLTLPQIANLLGLGMLIAGISGYVLGGFAADSRKSGRIGLMALLPLIALPTAFAGYAPGVGLAIAALATISLTTPMLNVAMNATVQEIVPNDMRGFSYAFLSVVAALPAGAGGPFAIAFVSEKVLGDPSRIAASFVLVVLPCLLLAAACFAAASRVYRTASVDGELARVIGASHS